MSLKSRHNMPKYRLLNTLQLVVLPFPKPLPPRPIATQLHALNLGRLEGVHGNAAHKADVHSESPMHSRARQADEDAKFRRRPLRRGRRAVAALVIEGRRRALNRL